MTGGDAVYSVGLRLIGAVLVCGFAVVAAVQTADGSVESQAVAEADDVQDVVFFGDRFPVFIRLRIRVDGESYQRAWRKYVNRFFFDLDGDGDGVLTAAEAQQIDAQHRPKRTIPLVTDIFAPPPPLWPKIPADRSPRDGRVSRDELAEYLRSQNKGAFSAQSQGIGPEPMQMAAGTLAGQALLEKLDRDGNGRLSAGELKTVADSLRRLDVNDDEAIDASELQPLGVNYGFAPPAAMRAPPANAAPALVVLEPDAAQRSALVNRLLETYDQDGADGPEVQHRLGPAELGWTAELFSRYDADADGTLDAAELARFLARPVPALEVVLRRGKRPNDEAPVEVSVVHSELYVEKPLAQRHGNWSSITLADAQLEILPGGAGSAAETANTKNFFEQQFNMIDADNNGYLEKTEIARSFYFQEDQFDQMDRDGDGKLFKKEVFAYVEQEQEAAASQSVLYVTRRGRDVFDLFDVDGDGRLGTREMRFAGERLAGLDRNGDGELNSGEIPQRFQLSVAAGRVGLLGDSVVAAGGQTLRDTNIPQRADAPVWFQKMDTNRDGDLSRREFLGPLSDFDRLDADGDGLLAPAEASKVD